MPAVTDLKVAFFLAYKRILRSGTLTTLLIIFVMMLTFLNLLFVRGILVGLPFGATKANEEKYYGDLFISAKENKKHIEEYRNILKTIDSKKISEAQAVRYITRGVATADFDDRVRDDEKNNSINVPIVGVDIINEEKLFKLTDSLIEGKLIGSNSKDHVLVGKDLVAKYSNAEISGIETLENIEIGSELEILIGTNKKRVEVVGFVETKVNEWDNAIIVSANLIKDVLPRNDFKPDEIALRLSRNITPNQAKKILEEEGMHRFANIETPQEYQPSFVQDIVTTFSILGDLVGTIGLIVASITIFIVIFVTAITSKKSIGILKGIGISSLAIEISYVLQAIFYSSIGSLLGATILYLLLIPYFDANPIEFPFADGVLLAEPNDAAFRTGILFIATAFAGYIPARIVVKQNTLDAILGK